MYPVYRKSILISISFIVLFMLACNATFTVGFPTPTIPPPTESPTATSVPTSLPPAISTQTYEEVGQNPAFTIKAQFPAILDNNAPGVSAFNTKAHDLLQTAIDEFKKGISELPNDPNFAASFLDVQYTLMYQTANIVSIKFDILFYASGAAHPGDSSVTLNFDLAQGRELTLGDLFLPNSNFLEVISAYCIAELGTRDIGFDGGFQQGADPTPVNYRNWNITPDGLMITFDTYQVGPGAAGPQTVIVPYDQIKAMINPQGPLEGFAQ